MMEGLVHMLGLMLNKLKVKQEEVPNLDIEIKDLRI